MVIYKSNKSINKPIEERQTLSQIRKPSLRTNTRTTK